MAYRFLLEVPESLADDAGTAVGAAGDAQIVVRRSKSHSLTYDDPYVDMTVAAHSLEVVPAVFAWFDRFRPSQPEIGIVLHSGERLSLKDHSRASLAAAIRRDQPWVERTAPKIGDHEEDYGSTGTVAAVRSSRSAAALLESPTELVEAPAKGVTIRALNHIALRRSEGLAGVLVASADGQAFKQPLEEIAREGVPVQVLGFREHASWALASDTLVFVDLEDIPGVFREPLPRIGLDSLPEQGAWLQPFRPLSSLLTSRVNN